MPNSNNTQVQHYETGAVERFNYSLFFLGQGMCYILVYSFLQQYALDIGISALVFAGIALVIKVWDAVNDTIFGVIVEKVHFRGGKYLPWLRMSIVLVPLSTLFIYAIPNSIPDGIKVVWLVVAYLLWDTAYTISDVPLYAMSTAMTSNAKERVLLISRGRFFGAVAIFLPMFLLPLVRTRLGGWFPTMVLFAVFCSVVMIPVCFKVRERVAVNTEKEKDPSLKEMFLFIVRNKYLLIFYIGYVLFYTFNIASTLSLVVARHCFGNEAYASLMSLALLVPPMLCALVVPYIIKKMDKFTLFMGSIVSMGILLVITYFVGYDNFQLFLILTVIRGIPYGFISTLSYTFIGDCCEYGTYKTGVDAKGVGFAAHTFFTKLMGATATALSSLCLAMIGYVELEGATQPASLPQNLWILYCLVPALGVAIGVPILSRYKLRDKIVNAITLFNQGKITREEAQKTIGDKI